LGISAHPVSGDQREPCGDRRKGISESQFLRTEFFGKQSAHRANIRSAAGHEHSVNVVSAGAGALEVRDASAPALFAAASLDGQPLARSRHLLVWAVTDAINSGMRFADAGRTTLQAIGSFPPRVQPVAATIRLRGLVASGLKAWPLALDGQRRTPLALRAVDGGTELSIDTTRLPDGPALFFEIAAE